jgi:transposase
MSQNVPRKRKRKGEDMAVLILAMGGTIELASQQAGVHRKTIQRWMKDPEFEGKVRKARGTLFDQAAGKLANLADQAIDTLEELLSARKDTVRLAAARTILGAGPKWRESTDLAGEIQRILEILVVEDL